MDNKKNWMDNIENCIHCGCRIVRSNIEDDEWLSYHLDGSYHDCRRIYRRLNSRAPPELQKELDKEKRALEEVKKILENSEWVHFDDERESSS